MNMSPKMVQFQKERSLVTIILEGLCEFSGVLGLECSDLGESKHEIHHIDESYLYS